MTETPRETVLYVAPDGDDAHDGEAPTRTGRGRRGPLATVGRARDRLREIRAQGRLRGPATIELAGGVHPIRTGLVLTAEDSGTPEAPLTLRAADGQEVRFTGGVAVNDWRPVTDRAVLARLAPEARGQVLAADLRALGVAEVGIFRSRGFGRPVAPAMLELFFRGEPMPLARWPNEGFTTIRGFPEAGAEDDQHGGKIGKLDEGFFYDGDRPARWATPTEAVVHGYWAWDWANSYERIASLDAQARHIRLAPPAGNYGFRAGQRIQFLNVFEELDQPGEWYADRATGMLYFWPPQAPAAGDTAVSVLEQPFVRLDGASHVRIAGLVFEHARGTGIEGNGGEDCRIEDCGFRNLGNYGVRLEGGRLHQVRGCVMSGLGDGGIEVSGGDRRTLTPAGHVVEANHIHHIARWSKCYVPAVHANGVGIRIAHNLIHDHPHCAILFGGNDFAIEYNEIHHVCLETGDVGAVYLGRDYTYRGNTVRHNYIHHTGGVGMGSMGVYNDDCVSGTVIFGNIFWRVQRAAFLGGGRDFRVENNVFVECTPAVSLDGRGLSSAPVWRNMVYDTMRKRLDDMNWRQPPYSTRYPELADLVPFYEGGAGIPPGNIVVARNLCVGGEWTEIYWGATADMVRFEDNLVGQDVGFVDAAAGNFALRPDSPAFGLGFLPIPVERIGLPARAASAARCGTPSTRPSACE